jgi:hypothetical protein
MRPLLALLALSMLVLAGCASESENFRSSTDGEIKARSELRKEGDKVVSNAPIVWLGKRWHKLTPVVSNCGRVCPDHDGTLVRISYSEQNVARRVLVIHVRRASHGTRELFEQGIETPIGPAIMSLQAAPCVGDAGGDGARSRRSYNCQDRVETLDVLVRGEGSDYVATIYLYGTLWADEAQVGLADVASELAVRERLGASK